MHGSTLCKNQIACIYHTFSGYECRNLTTSYFNEGKYVFSFYCIFPKWRPMVLINEAGKFFDFQVCLYNREYVLSQSASAYQGCVAILSMRSSRKLKRHRAALFFYDKSAAEKARRSAALVRRMIRRPQACATVTHLLLLRTSWGNMGFCRQAGEEMASSDARSRALKGRREARRRRVGAWPSEKKKVAPRRRASRIKASAVRRGSGVAYARGIN